MDSTGIHRPRNLDWRRAAALLYGDWGTSKAYVLGLGFVAAAYASLPIILAVCALTAVVGYNYILVCKYYPDGGGVYSAARLQSRLLAVIGALLLVANFIVTAAMSAWAAMSYLPGIPREHVSLAAAGIILVIGAMNYFGPKHTGSLALLLAAPTALVVLAIVALSLPHVTTEHLEPSHASFKQNWIWFTGVILALSGVEAIANLTGVMKLDAGATMEEPRVARTAGKAIFVVATEVVLVTALLGWAMLSVPKNLEPLLNQRWEDMIRFLAEHYGAINFGEAFGNVFGLVTGVVVGLLLLSAVNTAIGAMIGLMYMLARDGEMPRNFTRLNPHGVPWLPMLLATALPFIVVMLVTDLESLAGLYAIGVIGAITVNLGSCAFNAKLSLKMYERVIMGLTFLTLLVVELTIARTKNDALFFALCVLGSGLALRSYVQRRAGLRTVTVSQEVAAAVAPELLINLRANLIPGKTILVAARGLTPVLRFALEEARLRQSTLYVLYVSELAVALPGPLQSSERPLWRNDPQAREIMYPMIELGREFQVPVLPVYAVSDNPGATILDLAATLGIDLLILGSRHRRTLASLLKGDVVTEVAKNLPENIQLLLYG